MREAQYVNYEIMVCEVLTSVKMQVEVCYIMVFVGENAG
jgi:hypothetical protein